MKRLDGKKKQRGLHRGFEHLSSLDDPLKTVEVIERITGRKGNFRALLAEFDRRYGANLKAARALPAEDMLPEDVPPEVTPIDLSLKFEAVQPSFLQMPHEYTDKIAPMLHPYADIFYMKAWRDSYGRGRRVFFRGGLQYMLRGTSLKSRRAVETGRNILLKNCLLYTSPSPRDRTRTRMPSSA